MKISKITIKQLFGIKEWQGDGKNIELVGDNGTGTVSYTHLRAHETKVLEKHPLLTQSDMLLQIPPTVNLS